jgi:hypothetical protein
MITFYILLTEIDDRQRLPVPLVMPAVGDLIRVTRNRLGRCVIEYCAAGQPVPESAWKGKVAVYAPGLEAEFVSTKGKLP